MMKFEDLSLSKQLLNAVSDLHFDAPTPIQAEAFPLISSGRNIVGIAQTGTGKTLAYLLPLLRELKYSAQIPPRILILVPTRELVIQIVEQVELLTKYMNARVIGVYGGANINTQKAEVSKGCDVMVATPGRLYDIAMHGALKLKFIKKLVIDEVDVMLDLGFRYQLTNIFELLPEKRQNLMFSATMTEEVDALINDFFIAPVKISIAVSGTPLENIEQQCYPVKNFYTKVNLLSFLLEDKVNFHKVLVFVPGKKIADRLSDLLEESYGNELCVVHSNKSQNYRLRSVKQFDEGANRILVTTDVMARGLDLDKISHVINFDTPVFPENYMHRIGRTGRVEEKGHAILFYTKPEEDHKLAIERLMNYKIPVLKFPPDVKVSSQLSPEESPQVAEVHVKRATDKDKTEKSFHKKKLKNTKTNQGGSYLRKKKVYKKPKTRGDKNSNRKNKRR